MTAAWCSHWSGTLPWQLPVRCPWQRRLLEGSRHTCNKTGCTLPSCQNFQKIWVLYSSWNILNIFLRFGGLSQHLWASYSCFSALSQICAFYYHCTHCVEIELWWEQLNISFSTEALFSTLKCAGSQTSPTPRHASLHDWPLLEVVTFVLVRSGQTGWALEEPYTSTPHTTKYLRDERKI